MIVRDSKDSLTNFIGVHMVYSRSKITVKAEFWKQAVYYSAFILILFGILNIAMTYQAQANDKTYYQKIIAAKRAEIVEEKDAMKRDNSDYAKKIKSSSSASGKASLRQSKIDCAKRHKDKIQNLKNDIAAAQAEMKKCKK